MPKKKIAVYPGTFDPVTLGHLDVIKRAAGIFDTIIVAVAKSTTKGTLFGIDERVEMLSSSLRGLKNVRVESFGGLLVEFAKTKKAAAVIRGIRSFSDFEYESPMALTNRKIEASLETIFVLPSIEYAYISSTLVKDVAANGGNVSEFVTKQVKMRLEEKFAKN